jgi:phthiocerol/phenolphthiocerol synthesis type-I polyketide synthase E
MIAGYSDTAIAIVGSAGRFPGGTDANTIWPLLEAGGSAIRAISPGEAEDGGDEGIDPGAPGWIGVTADIQDPYLFDPAFFGMAERDTELTDPQHRVMLECASEALQNAGIKPRAFHGRIGVYAGATTSRYLLRLLRNTRLREIFGADQIAFGNNLDYLATGISYRLGLTGPSLTVQTACSTSLVCVHVGVEALLAGECDLAIAGGVSIRVPQNTGYMYREGGILSRDGSVRPFDRNATGTVIGNGCGVVVLQRLADALEQRNTISGVLLGSSVNNDGADKVGFTAPSYSGQRAAITAALATAGIDPNSISYVEGHGTGTVMGDPIEFAALSDAFREMGARGQGYCSLGSIKANIGHLDAAAGIAGLIKLLLMFRNRTLVPLSGFEHVNRSITLAQSPFTFTRTACPWEIASTPRRAGISSLGIGGTNVHMILEEPPSPSVARPRRSGWHVLPISADSPAALEQTGRSIADAIASNQDTELGDIARTLQVGRPDRPLRRAVIAPNNERAVEALRAMVPVTQALSGHTPKLCWAFSGQGTSYDPGMATLLRSNGLARQSCQSSMALLPTENRGEISDLLNGQVPQEPLAQTTILTLHLALADVWRAWGSVPDCVLGHSLGEYAAAVAACIFDRGTALALVSERQRLMATAKHGGMLAIQAPKSIVEKLLPPNLEIAVINAPDWLVVAGRETDVETFDRKLAAIGIWTKRLATPGAFHSRLMVDMVEPFAVALGKHPLHLPKSPFLSSVTGRWLTPAEATSPQYWSRQLHSQVDFAAALSLLATEGGWTVLEIGTDATISRFAAISEVNAVPSFSGTGTETPLVEAAASLWQRGFSVTWDALRMDPDARRVPLPPTSLSRRRFLADITRDLTPDGREPNLDRWFFLPTWAARPRIVPEAAGPPRECDLIFCTPPSELAEQVAAELQKGNRLTRIPLPEGEAAAIDQGVARSYFLGKFKEAGPRLDGSSKQFLWLTTRPTGAGDDPTRLFYLFLAFLQAIATSAKDEHTRVFVVTIGADAITPGDVASPELGMVAALSLVARQEFTNIDIHRVDMPESHSATDVQLLVSILQDGINAPDVGVRQGALWSPVFEPMVLPARKSAFRSGGTYLILGGLGRFGMILAGHLARAHQANAVLVSRNRSPDDDVRVGSGGDHFKLRQLADLPGKRLLEHADLADTDAVEALFQRVETAFGRIDGVIHAAGSIGLDAHVPIEDMDREAAELHFKPKVLGLHALGKALAKRHIDFCLFTSSLSPFLGGIGLGAYAAAHGYMDRCAARFRAHEIPCQTINWEGWLPSTPDTQRGPGRQHFQLALNDDEIATCIERLAAVPELTQAVVATTSLSRRREQWTEGANSQSVAQSGEQRPQAGDVLTTVRNLIMELLGRSEIGDSVNLFDIGANSLTMVQIAARVRQVLGVDLRLRAVFEAPTVAALAAAIEGREAQTLEALIERIEAMTDEEIEIAERRETYSDLTLASGPASKPAVQDDKA